MNFREYLNEAKILKLPNDINKSYLLKNTIKHKEFNFTDEGDLMSGNVWIGQLPKSTKYGIVFASFDMGIQSKTKGFSTEQEANDVFDKFKDKISYDDILKLMK